MKPSSDFQFHPFPRRTMFDGKHVSRRVINLGSKNSKQSIGNHATRPSVLQEAQQKRELRQLQAKKNAAAILLQRQIRGFLARRSLAKELDEILLKPSSASLSWLNMASMFVFRLSPPMNRIAPNFHCQDLDTLTWNVLRILADTIHSMEAIPVPNKSATQCAFIVSKLIVCILESIARYYLHPSTWSCAVEEHWVHIFTLVETWVSQSPPTYFPTDNPLYWAQLWISPFYPSKTTLSDPPLLCLIFHTLTVLQGSLISTHTQGILHISKRLLNIACQACVVLATISIDSQSYTTILPQREAINLFAMLLFTSPPSLLESVLQVAFSSTTSYTSHPTQLDPILDYTLFYLHCARLYFGCPLSLTSSADLDYSIVCPDRFSLQEWFSSMLDSLLLILLSRPLHSTSWVSVNHVYPMIQTKTLGTQVILVDNLFSFLPYIVEAKQADSSMSSPSSYSLISNLIHFLALFVTSSTDWSDHTMRILDRSNQICTLVLASCIAQDGGVGGKTWNGVQSYAQGRYTLDSDRMADMDTIMMDIPDNSPALMVEDDEDEDEEDAPKPILVDTTCRNNPLLDHGEYHASKRQKKTIMESFGRKLSKDDLRTTSKLNTMYQLQRNRDRVYAFQYLDSLVSQDSAYHDKDKGYSSRWVSNSHLITSIAKISKLLGEGELLMKLGSILTSAPSMTHSDLECFVLILSRVLSSCSGIHSRSNGPQFTILSKFAFDTNLLETIWRYILFQGNPTRDGPLEAKLSLPMNEAPSKDMLNSKIVFCDLFSHHLLAMDDDDFHQRFLIPSNKSQIRIEDVIVMLKDGLWDAYWLKPVTCQDIVSSMYDEPPYYRLRFFLSCTKLFNDLYERWSRLTNNIPFCNESLWWFSYLPIHDDSGAVSRGSVVSDDTLMQEDAFGDDNNTANAVNANSSQEEAQHDALASCFKDPRLARILTAIPQVLPFERRTKIFHSLLNVDKEKRQEDEVAFMHARARAMFHGDLDDNSITSGREQVTIRRDALYQDSKEKLSSLGKRLRRQLKVTFVNQLGAHEAGIDGGGVFREFLDDLIKDAFNPSNHHQNIPPLFVESPNQLLCVNLEARRSQEILQHYEFFGQIIGKAVYESVLVEAQFCLPFLNQLLGKHNTLDDLKNLDPDFHKHLVSLRSMKRDEIENLGLTFELGNMELIPNGSFMNVTKENVIRYIHLVAHRRLNQDTAYQTRAFLKGFRDLIPAPWVRLFSARELQKVIGGDDSIKGIDVDGLKAVMQYSGGYHPSQPIIHWFWEILADMSPSQQRKFLKFMTSCSRQPLLGFQSLIPLPCIQQIRISEMEFESFQVTTNNNCRLPTSSTCMNLLKLPNYPSKEILRSKLVYAIESGAGFELS